MNHRQRILLSSPQFPILESMSDIGKPLLTFFYFFISILRRRLFLLLFFLHIVVVDSIVPYYCHTFQMKTRPETSHTKYHRLFHPRLDQPPSPHVFVALLLSLIVKPTYSCVSKRLFSLGFVLVCLSCSSQPRVYISDTSASVTYPQPLRRIFAWWLGVICQPNAPGCQTAASSNASRYTTIVLICPYLNEVLSCLLFF